MAGTDRSSKGEVLDVVGGNGGDLTKNFGVYLGAMGSHLFVSFRHLKQQKSVTSICLFTVFFDGWEFPSFGAGTIPVLCIIIFPAPMQWTINKYFE